MKYIIGGKLKILKSNFWPAKFTNIGSEYTERCRIGTFGGWVGGGMFPKKSWFCWYFYEIIMISDFWGYNGAQLCPQKSKIMIISWKYCEHQLFLGNIPQKIFYCASFGKSPKSLISKFTKRTWTMVMCAKCSQECANN